MKLMRAVSFVITDKQKKILAVKRPHSDKEFPGVWSLPATLVHNGETLRHAVLRGTKEKLNIAVKIIKTIGKMRQKRNGYELQMTDFEVRIVTGIPDYSKATTTGTKYVNQRWVDTPLFFQKAAKSGACCSQVFLLSKKLLSKENLIKDLTVKKKI
jgi:8-oxo-dGTP pyrophosphatase MutT (NUDIX family)